jgi:hypothetical protein
LVSEDLSSDSFQIVTHQIAKSSIHRMLKIDISAYDVLRAHGERTYPHECCGVLLGQESGDERLVTMAAPCGNTRSDSPQNR